MSFFPASVARRKAASAADSTLSSSTVELMEAKKIATFTKAHRVGVLVNPARRAGLTSPNSTAWHWYALPIALVYLTKELDRIVPLGRGGWHRQLQHLPKSKWRCNHPNIVIGQDGVFVRGALTSLLTVSTVFGSPPDLDSFLLTPHGKTPLFANEEERPRSMQSLGDQIAHDPTLE